MPLNKPLVVLKSQGQGKYDKQLLYNMVVDVLREPLDRRPVALHHLRVWPVGVLCGELGDVVDFEVVLYSGDQVAGPGRLPAIVISRFEVCSKGELLLVGPRQDGCGEGELGVDVFSAQAVILDVEESWIEQLFSLELVWNSGSTSVTTYRLLQWLLKTRQLTLAFLQADQT